MAATERSISSSPPPSNFLSALRPTSYETVLLSLYPAILLLGSIFSVLDPSARAAPYNAAIQSHPPAQAPAYFAKKSNILNVFFVKIAWFWITAAFYAFLFTSSSTGPRSPPAVLTPKRLRGILRWSLVTGWWILVTQWCFGPPLIDRGFRITGGVCELADRLEGQGGKAELYTSQACKSIGGAWRGGHDISGHVFILVLGSAFLMLEVLPVWLGRPEQRKVVKQSGDVSTIIEGKIIENQPDETGTGQRYGRWMTLLVVGLSWWMLLMTAAYFHTWFEKVTSLLFRHFPPPPLSPPPSMKPTPLLISFPFQQLTGLLVAFLGVLAVYFVPRLFPGARDIIGMPGV